LSILSPVHHLILEVLLSTGQRKKFFVESATPALREFFGLSKTEKFPTNDSTTASIDEEDEEDEEAEGGRKEQGGDGEEVFERGDGSGRRPKVRLPASVGVSGNQHSSGTSEIKEFEAGRALSARRWRMEERFDFFVAHLQPFFNTHVATAKRGIKVFAGHAIPISAHVRLKEVIFFPPPLPPFPPSPPSPLPLFSPSPLPISRSRPK
jgi:hypothetical protein